MQASGKGKQKQKIVVFWHTFCRLTEVWQKCDHPDPSRELLNSQVLEGEPTVGVLNGEKEITENTSLNSFSLWKTNY